MNKKEAKDFCKYVSDCACVAKGDSDSRDTHAKFKITCAENLDRMEEYLSELNNYCLLKSDEMISAGFRDYDLQVKNIVDNTNMGQKKKETAIAKLDEKYAEDIKTFNAYSDWFDQYMNGEAELPELVMWGFEDLPEKISGGYIKALEPMVSGFPEIG